MLLSASTDHKVKLWTEEGALVGMFGQESGLWDVKDPSTWTQQEPQPVSNITDKRQIKTLKFKLHFGISNECSHHKQSKCVILLILGLLTAFL